MIAKTDEIHGKQIMREEFQQKANDQNHRKYYNTERSSKSGKNPVLYIF